MPQFRNNKLSHQVSHYSTSLSARWILFVFSHKKWKILRTQVWIVVLLICGISVLTAAPRLHERGSCGIQGKIWTHPGVLGSLWNPIKKLWPLLRREVYFFPRSSVQMPACNLPRATGMTNCYSTQQFVGWITWTPNLLDNNVSGRVSTALVA